MEKTLEDRFVELMVATDMKSLEFYPFDFHTKCHKNSDPMIEQIKLFLMPNILQPSKLFEQTIRVVVEELSGIKT